MTRTAPTAPAPGEVLPPPREPGAARRSPLSRVRDAIFRYGLLILLAALVVVFAVTQPAFFTTFNLLSILLSVAVVAIVALGVTVSMSVDGFDLSVGSTVSITVMLTAASLVYWGLGPVLAVLIGLVTGTVIGLINGLLIVVARVPDMLATLGTMFVFAGGSLLITAGQSIASGSGYQGAAPKGSFTDAFTWLGQGDVLGVPVPVIVLVVVTVAVILFLVRTRSGRLLRAVGGNREAARLAGARVGRLRVLAYVISGFLAGLGGVLLAARTGRGDVNVGADYLLQAVSAALIGFAVLGANRPNAFGTVVGAIFVGVVLNGLTMLNAPYYAQDFVQGLLLVGALVVSFSALFNRKAAR
ncbi:ABC transporter permease [Amnibacterium kyonggiense]|uniref:Monosaccharide ABC transporter membrane protein (CUT2 family) n=1 Tax=Amnibacterium kyonggiense TaxID=595671 RepID=A0A4R7FSK1_9MICO|nr:ABC transporter permease [Amnibacterium kyonggiense]TDS80728.1 monosaccharide ABC transporter membrane protein (CUT2 family) [Amnibacterium kyonggiense]